MGLLDSLFGKKNGVLQEQRKALPWVALTSTAQLEDIVERSEQRPQVIFKHSTTCGISRMVLQMFTNDYDLSENSVDLYYLDLHQYREVSNQTAMQFGVMHQSPQLIVIKNGDVVVHESHGAITDIDLSDYL
ncbi:bacillithiol system redox-active protein YtxJ [Poritiphilus flavus]|uniref:Bacillithiol system redox-active protein YtxJ n=1 Tax=Poritiphilus flavus TaxID=2697053 RepID=A0A6L9EGM6_9FLAO|nr:bacillithiol system redox-active protein YtxJ [Poritiphilus flavus]NAS13409.1 bacillithiol system redox-active protein YtxJ [Poritiphilus flavus]